MSVSRIVVDLEDRRPVWAMPDWAADELRAAAPPGWDVHISRSLADGSGDGATEPTREVLDAVAGARVYIGFGIPEAVLRAGMDTLEWVHTGAAGVGGSLHDPMRESSVRFTNSAGVHGPPIAETVLGMLLYFARGLDFAVSGQRRREWNDAPFLGGDTPIRELEAMTVGILGYGGIGREVGRRLRALGVPVLGLRGSREGAVEDDYGATLLYGDAGLDRLLCDSDALVVAAPDTPRTRGMLTSERLRKLRGGAIVVNVARGRLVDEEALLAVLQEGHLRGAALDVFCSEPLPAEHPFWGLDNVLITPHVSPVTHGFWRREMDLILENLSRFIGGGTMLNEVDRSRGY